MTAPREPGRIWLTAAIALGTGFISAAVTVVGTVLIMGANVVLQRQTEFATQQAMVLARVGTIENTYVNVTRVFEQQVATNKILSDIQDRMTSLETVTAAQLTAIRLVQSTPALATLAENNELRAKILRLQEHDEGK